MKKFATIAVLSVLSVSAVRTAQAATYDANAAFKANELPDGAESNPFGAFTAGYTAGLGGAFTTYTQAQHTDTYNGKTGLEGYSLNNFVPVTLINTNSTTLDTGFGVNLEPSEILLHPDASNYGVLRFTVPVGAGGTYNIAGNFEKLNSAGNGEDVHVVINSMVTGGTTAFDKSLVSADTENDTPGTFNLQNITLAAGDTVDFSVGPNGNGDYGSDSTGLFATITTAPVPEPAIAGTVLLGGLAALKLRRRGTAI